MCHFTTLLLGHWYEIMALYYVKSILTQISASRQDRRVLQKNKIIRIKFLSILGMLKTSRYVQKSRNLEKMILTEIPQCTVVLYSHWSFWVPSDPSEMTNLAAVHCEISVKIVFFQIFRFLDVSRRHYFIPMP